MESIGEAMQKALDRLLAAKPSFSEELRKTMEETRDFTPLQWEQRKADRENQTPGNLDEADGYSCRKCMNRGYFIRVEDCDGAVYTRSEECSCMNARRSLRRLKASGLQNVIHDYTFANFETREPWQQTMLDTAKRYVSEGAQAGSWFFVGGAVGSGKTHICTAIAGKLLHRMSLRYMTWPSASAKLKALVSDEEEYGRELGKLKEIEALYIDDFFKPIQSDRGPLLPTPADVRLAYELINHRYVNRAVTIISSERYLDELMDIDEATASRIAERSRGYCLILGRDKNKNQRIRTDTPL